MWIRNLLTPLFIMNLVLCLSASAFAETNRGIASKLSVGLGWERLEYEEYEPETALESDAQVNNGILTFEGLKRWTHLFGGIKAVIPVLLGDDDEVWTRSGTLQQTNTLEFSWLRADGFLGYPIKHWLNPYAGLRWAESRQDRTNFVVSGIPIGGTSVEKVRYWSLLLGLRGNGNFTSRWVWNYSLEYFYPLDVEVTNTALPGFETSADDGYTLEAKIGVEYFYTEKLSFGLLLYGGRMHWDGSGWQPFAGGLAKWPENDTRYLGATLHMSWTF